MAKAKMPVQLPAKVYVLSETGNKADKMLGPHKIFTQGGRRVVLLNEKQAKYYLTVGAITEQ